MAQYIGGLNLSYDNIISPSSAGYIFDNANGVVFTGGVNQLTRKANNPAGINIWGNGSSNNYTMYCSDNTQATVSISIQPEASSVPEPATLIVWSLLGGIGIAFGYWRRKRAA